MATLAPDEVDHVRAAGVRFVGDVLYIELTDGRQIGLDVRRIGWLGWLAQASLEQRANWSVEPGGFAVYWNDLDDGIELCHVLGLQSLS